MYRSQICILSKVVDKLVHSDPSGFISSLSAVGRLAQLHNSVCVCIVLHNGNLTNFSKLRDTLRVYLYTGAILLLILHTVDIFIFPVFPTKHALTKWFIRMFD